MKRNRARKVIVHMSDNFDYRELTERMSRFHAQVIERVLERTNLPNERKIEIIDKIIADLKSRESNGIIRQE